MIKRYCNKCEAELPKPTKKRPNYQLQVVTVDDPECLEGEDAASGDLEEWPDLCGLCIVKLRKEGWLTR